MAWAGLALGIINLGFTVSEKVLRVSALHRVGSDVPELRRTLNRLIFRMGHLSYYAREGIEPDGDLIEEVRQLRDAIGEAVPENADADLTAHLALTVHEIDGAIELRASGEPVTATERCWDKAEDRAMRSLERLNELTTHTVWRWKA